MNRNFLKLRSNIVVRVIIAHNHPSGNPQPSSNDQELTARLAEAGDILGIELLDYLVIGNDSYFSFSII